MGGSNQSKFYGDRYYPALNGLDSNYGFPEGGLSEGIHAVSNGVTMASGNLPFGASSGGANGFSNGMASFYSQRQALASQGIRILQEDEIDEEDEEPSYDPSTPAATEVDSSNMTDEDMKGLVDAMRCMSCGWIPKPESRFVCLDGHHFCLVCGKERIDKLGSICGLEMTKLVHPTTLGQRETSGGKDNNSPGSTTASQIWFCQKKVQQIGRDPVYCALFNNLKVKCPVSDHPAANCKKEISGGELESHLVECTMTLASNLGVTLPK